MQRRSSLKYFYLIAGAVMLLIGFNNCGEGFISADSSTGASVFFSRAPGESCDAGLMRVFQGTYHPFLAQTCNGCHVNGPGIGTFADSNPVRAFNSFMSIGPMKISNQALNDAHKPPATGAHNGPVIDSIKGAWANAELEYLTCVSESGGSNGSTVRTANKPVPANLTATNYMKLTWDLESESNVRIPLVATIELRKANISGQVRGYEFRNPTLRLKDAMSGNYNVRGINFYVDNHFQSGITTYTNIDSVISTTTDMNLAPGHANALAVYPEAPGTLIALEYGSLQPTSASGGVTPTPTPVGPGTPVQRVTFATLSGAGGIFANSCANCHSGANPRGGLNITDYNSARNAAANIKARVNNAANPMPTGGLLPAAQRDMISAWVDAGAPQN